MRRTWGIVKKQNISIFYNDWTKKKKKSSLVWNSNWYFNGLRDCLHGIMYDTWETFVLREFAPINYLS